MKRYICDWCKKETDKLTEGWGEMDVKAPEAANDVWSWETEHMCPHCRKHLKLD